MRRGPSFEDILCESTRTLDYAAPEQFTGEPLTPQTDVYSLGCVLYECLTASMPFPRDREAAVLHAHLNESPPRPTHERPELPSAVDAVVEKAMAKKPDDRYRSAGDLARAAREALGVGPAQPSVKRSRLPSLAIGGGLAAAIVVLVSLLVFARGGSTPAASTGATASPSSTPAVGFARGVLSIDPKTGAIGTRISGPGISFARTAPGVIAAGEGGIWTIEGLAVVHIDPRDGSAARISVNFPVSNIAIGDGAIWAGGATSAAGPDNLDRIDPATDEVRVELSNLGHFAATVTGVVAVGGTVWVADSTGELTRVSAGGTKAGRVVQLASDISGLALGEVSMWAIDALGGDVLKLSTRTGELENTIPVSGNLDALAVGLGSVWVIDSTAGTVLRIDAQTDQPSGPIRVGKYPTSVAVGFGAVWVTNQGDGTLSRIDPVTNESMPVQIGAPVSAVVADRQSGKLWVIVSQGPSGG